MEEKGKVKWFNSTKGFGFINRENDDEDIFVHYTQIINQTGFKGLNSGDEVTFTVFKTKNGLQAKDVSKVVSR
ncbi:MAG: cold shock domain-containing protein [Erysipelotrichaceae bacterium]|nr:cold shock domain-containing protein [Erysipelotrichaceae bacterium]